MISIDSQVIVRIITALLGDPRAGASLMEVSHEHGAVTLSGTVLSEEARRAIEGIVRRQAGVVTIINNLSVRPQPVRINREPHTLSVSLAQPEGKSL